MLGTLLIITCTILWATDTIFRQPLVQSLDASTIILLEHVVCTITTLPLFLVRSRETTKLGFTGWMSLLFLGLVGSAAGTFLFTSSFRYINPSVPVLLQKLQPIFAVAGARLVLGESPKRSFYFWAFLALVASMMVSVPELWTLDEFKNGFPSLRSGHTERDTGIAFAVGAACIWGLSTVFGKLVTNRVSFPVTSFFRFLFGFIGTLVLSATISRNFRVPLLNIFVYFSSDSDAIRSILYMALVPGVLAMYLYYAGLKRTKASHATIAELCLPVAAIAVNWYFLGQTLVMMQFVGVFLLMFAVFFINRGLK